MARLSSGALLPEWATQGDFWTVSRTPDELSVLCAAAQVPPEVQAQRGWAALKLHGPFAFALTGILASVLDPLAQAGIGIFAVSTFDTDYVLLPGEQLGAAQQALQQAGHHFLS